MRRRKPRSRRKWGLVRVRSANQLAAPASTKKRGIPHAKKNVMKAFELLF